jgi:hypothetical protein
MDKAAPLGDDIGASGSYRQNIHMIERISSFPTFARRNTSRWICPNKAESSKENRCNVSLRHRMTNAGAWNLAGTPQHATADTVQEAGAAGQPTPGGEISIAVVVGPE